MHVPALAPRRLPERVVVVGTPGDALTRFLQRLAGTLDVPLVPLADLAGPAELARLAAFGGWVTTAEEEWARPMLLDRAELLVRVELEAASFTGRVRRTLRRIRSDVREPDHGWVEDARLAHPDLELVRLPDPASAETWLASL